MKKVIAQSWHGPCSNATRTRSVFCFKSVTEQAGGQNERWGSKLNLALGPTKCLRLCISGVKQPVGLQMAVEISIGTANHSLRY